VLSTGHFVDRYLLTRVQPTGMSNVSKTTTQALWH